MVKEYASIYSQITLRHQLNIGNKIMKESMSYAKYICWGLFGWALYINPVFACDSGLPTQGSRDDILILVNDNSTDSCEVGRYYAEKRDLGQSNILHLALPSTHLLLYPEFRIMMDRIIKHMQDNTLQAGAPPAPVCSGNEGSYYCQASMDHLRANTKLRYLVMTRGMPTRSPIAGSTLAHTSSASIDNYLSYWLLRYFANDVKLNFNEREKAFGDGRNMRVVDPAADGELIVGRIDGIDLAASKALIDRIISAEDNGIYGKLYGSQFGTYSGRAQWLNFDTNQLVYGTAGSGANADSWRYQLGMWGEARPECIDYLNFSQSSANGKAPQHCDVRFSASPPGRASSRTPIADDALVYLGQLHGQSSGGGSFDTVLNWVKNDSCTVKLCENAADPTACQALSTDVFKEINTECVGVADGFMGYNYQSFPVAAMNLWPTGYRGSGSGGTNSRIAFPEVRTDIGQDNNFSLWFRNTDSVGTPLCYDTSDFTNAPAVACREGHQMLLYPQVNVGSQVVNTATPQQYNINFWYRADNVTEGDSVRIRLRVYEPTAKVWVDYGTRNLGPFAVGNTPWTNIDTTFQLDPALHTQADLVFNKMEIYVYSGLYTGELAVDNFSIQELTTSTNLTNNGSFTEGHKEVSGGDHAAMYLSRLNGVAYWGSLSHHESGGHSFSNNPMETLLYFVRGLPLGDAVWWGETHNSGIFYGDPIYSPVAVRFDYKNSADYVTGLVNLTASTINGRNLSKVTTTYAVDYCSGSDFYLCDQAGNWQTAGLSGTGGQTQTALGSWDASSLPFGAYTLRLAVTSTNIATAKSQTLYDYYPVTVYDPAADDDADGLNNSLEVVTYGSNPTLTDSDGDGLSDGDEVNQYGSNPANNDTDGDGMRDAWEVTNGLNLLDANDAILDADNDGLNNLGEFQNNADPNNTDSDGDGLSDGDEVNTYGSSPIRVDSDFDGLSDNDEINLYGSNPANNDTDGDGMQDGWEVTNGLNLLAASDATLDADNDGLNNLGEFQNNADPNNTDSDGDGLSDGDEVNIHGSSPSRADTDFDGLSDNDEINLYGSNPANNDTDGDGMRDAWEVTNGLNLLDANDAILDADNDGLNNLGEFQNNADPNNTDSDGDGLSDGDEVNIHGSSPSRADTDFDGLSDGDEITQGTDLSNADTDGDGIKDGYEVTYGLNPLIDDASLDPDSDGLDNLAESVANSDPNNSDTDADGLNDGDEVNTHLTSPILSDTDDDRLSDRDELNTHGTNPLSAVDTDLDQIPDDWENVFGFDANDEADGQQDADNDDASNYLEWWRNTDANSNTSTPLFQTVYVDNTDCNMSGTPDGSSGNPFCTFNEGVAAAQGGDTLEITGGTYNLSNFFFTVATPIKIQATAGDRVSLNCGFNPGFGGFTLNDIAWGGISGIDFNCDFGISIVRSRNITFDNNSLIDFQYVTALRIADNTTATVSNTLIKGNTTGILFAGINTQVNLTNLTITENNLGISFNATNVPTFSVKNSIIYGNTTNINASASTLAISYSLIDDPLFNGINNNILVDPLFIDVAIGDYHLQALSPAIDAGHPFDAFDNEPENNGDRINMGYYGNTVEATSGIDTDGDGLTNQNEQCFDNNCGDYNPYNSAINPTGTDLDTTAIDTDGDGLNDNAELSAGTNPIDPTDPNNPIIFGDINGDGVVNVADILIGQRIVQGILPPATGSQLLRADVAPLINGTPAPNGVFNTADLLVIQRKVLGLVNY